MVESFLRKINLGLGLVFLGLSCGCSSFTAKPYQERFTQSTLVTWKTSDDVEKDCLAEGAKPSFLQNIVGCAKYNQYTCQITTAKNTSMEILGHELRHCFEGKFHK